MKYLLDTHILIWSLTDDPRLSVAARQIINNSTHHMFYSTVSIWEVAIKYQLHPVKMSCSSKDLLTYCNVSDMTNVPLLDRHVLAIEKLLIGVSDMPHKDPFDRILLAQAMEEHMIFITHDKKLSAYRGVSIQLV